MISKRLPPRALMRFFRWYCHRDLVDHIEGDLLEEYQLRLHSFGKARADLRFMIDVILLFRPDIIRSPERPKHINTLAMYKNYFTVGWRNLLRNRGYSLINIGGLAIGMTVAMLNGLWIWDELSFNTHFKKYDRLALVSEIGIDHDTQFTSVSMTYPLATSLMEDYKGNFENISRSSWESEAIMAAGDKKLSALGLYTDSSMPDILTLDMTSGTRAGLASGQSVLLSASLAKALFGYDDAQGKTIRINNQLDATVTGVYQDLPRNTRFAGIKFFGSWDLWLTEQPWIEQRALNDWRNHFLQIYVELPDGLSFEDAAVRVGPALKFDPADQERAAQGKNRLGLYPMSRWHLHGFSRGRPDESALTMVKLVGAIGMFILLLACINFMNLSTARSERRAKEVGIRKTIGSVRSQLISQFFSESFLVVCLAFVASLFLTWICVPAFNQLSWKDIVMPWTNIYFWGASFFFCIVTSVIAGSYPALYLSSFIPIKTLKGTFRAGRFAAAPRKVLVVTQFSISVVLIISTAVIYQQIQFAKDRPVGYNRDNLLMIPKKTPDFYGKYNVLRAELLRTGVVEEVSESMGAVTQVVSGNNGWEWKGKDPNYDESFVTHAVSHTHGRTVGWQFVAGHDFSIDNAGDSTGLIINESTARIMGLKDPVGEPVTWKWWADGRVLDYKIIGVIKDFVMDSPYATTSPAVFYLKGFNGKPNWINIRVKPNSSMSIAIPKIERVFRNLIPAAPFEYKFVDEEYALKFAAEERIGTLASVFAALAIFISCLGLFGLASFVAEQRTKEIGIRKVLGATVSAIWQMLSKDFVLLVLISCAISVPIAWYVMSSWLENYNYRIELSWWTFLLTCSVAILITLLTVSVQAIKAGITNPVKSLRTE